MGSRNYYDGFNLPWEEDSGQSLGDKEYYANLDSEYGELIGELRYVIKKVKEAVKQNRLNLDEKVVAVALGLMQIRHASGLLDQEWSEEDDEG